MNAKLFQNLIRSFVNRPMLPRSAQICVQDGGSNACEISNPIRKRIVIRNGFRDVISSFVNRPYVVSLHFSDF